MRPHALTLLTLLGCAPHARDGLVSTPTAAEARGVRLDVADALIDAGRPDAALALLAEDGGARDPASQVLSARALRASGLQDAARSRLEALVARHPRRADAWNELGLARHADGDAAGAADALERATSLESDNAAYWNNYGFALVTAGRYAEAQAALDRALDLDGHSARVRVNLGYALAAQGRTSEALQLFESTDDPAEARYKLGVGRELGGDLSGAADAWNEALARAPDHARAAAALARIAGGEGVP